VEILKSKFVNVAIDQWYQRRRKDAEGDYYRRIATQGPRKDMNETTQGLYACSADGKLLGYTNNRGPEAVKRLLKKALQDFQPLPAARIDAGKQDPQFARTLPEGGLTVTVTSKVLADREETDDKRTKIFQSSLGRDNLWIRKDEHDAIVKGNLLESLKRRIARFHLIDNTRGEPPMWEGEEICKLDLSLTKGRLKGSMRLETKSGDRGYEVEILGVIETKDGKVVRFDAVAKGLFWGHGSYTGAAAPSGKFPLAIAFTLSEGKEEADKVPPQGTKGRLPGYLNP
jgi:hypothetical protein